MVAGSLWPGSHIAKCSRCELPKHHETCTGRMFQNLWQNSSIGAMRGVGERRRVVSRLATAKRSLLRAAAVGAMTVPGALMSPSACGQVAETLPEVTITAPRPPPARRVARAVTHARSAPATRVSPPAAPTPQIPAFQAVATTPVTGLGVDRDKLPAMVQTLPAQDFSRVYSPNVTQTLDQRIPGVLISDAQGNEFTSDLRYRGFTASPLQGTPQGLAVYMQGIRVNEAFGDTVNWDLIPNIAVGRADVWTNNPAFGLNALGGAISFQMKDGFTYRGTEFDTSGGSYGRVGGSLQYGVTNGEWGLYLAAQGVKDDGWRYQSPSRIARFYGALGWKGAAAEVRLVASKVGQFFGVIEPNEARLRAPDGRYAITGRWTVQSNLYVRTFQRGSLLIDTLCVENDRFSTRPPANVQSLNPNNQPIRYAPGGDNSCAPAPWGRVDRTFINALTTSENLQAATTTR